MNSYVELVCPYCRISYEFKLGEIPANDVLCIYCGMPLAWDGWM